MAILGACKLRCKCWIHDELLEHSPVGFIHGVASVASHRKGDRWKERAETKRKEIGGKSSVFIP